MAYRLLSSFLAITCCTAVFSSELFSPPSCDFSVVFPSKYETREIFSPTGQSTLVAKNPNGQSVKISAECWPLQGVSPRDYAKGLTPKFVERGIQVHSVNLAKGNFGDIVTLAGSAGEGAGKYYIRYESFFGPKTRLDLLVLEKSPIASEDHLSFRNSVRIK